MPQMAPMMWLILFILFITFFLFFNILNYFNFIKVKNKISSELNNKTINQMKNFLMWKW